MKHSIVTKIGLVCFLSMLVPVLVLASGTPAGTVITNYATMNYKDLAGNSFPAFNSNTISITVKQVAGVALTPATASGSSGDSSFVTYPFQITNTGNGTDKYNLVIGSTQGWTPKMYLDANKNGVLEAAEITAGEVTVTPTLPADSIAYLVARLYVPDNTANGTVDQATVTATSQYTNTVTASGVYATTISTAVIRLAKTFSVMNPAPGQTTTLTVTYSNDGTSTATGAVVTNPVDPRLTFVSNSIVTSNGTATYNSATHSITWTIGRIGAGQSGTLTWDLTVNAGVPAGTRVGTQATITYTDSSSNVTRSVTSQATLMTVSAVASGTATISPSSQSTDVGMKAQYAFTLTNTGNAEDSTRITVSSKLGLTYTFWVDANNDGIAGNDGDYIINPNSTGAIAANGGTMHLIAVTTIPTLTTDRSVDSTRFVFTSQSNPSVSGTATGVLTVKAPVMSLVKSYSIVGGGDPVPGAIVVFTLAYQNNGTGAAASIVLSDNIMTDMTYQANTIKLNGVAQSDGTDADASQYSSGNVVVNLGSVGAGASGTIEFRAKIN